MKNVLFFDVDSMGIKRYSTRITKEIKENQEEVEVTACFLFGEISIIDKDLFDNIIIMSDFYFSAGKIIDFVKPDVVVVFAHRLPDYAFVVEANKRGIKTITMQHGEERVNIYESTLKDIVRVWRNKRQKLECYYKILRKLFKDNNMSCFKYIGKLCKKTELHNYMYNIFNTKSVSDYALVYGEYWKKYYSETYYNANDNIYVIGSPDLDGFNKDLKEPSEPTVCYLATILVEDAMVSKEKFLEFISCLSKATKKYKVKIKLHPRSDKQLYSVFENAEFIEGNDFPIAHLYVGHMSTINSKALYVTDNLLLYNFDSNVRNTYSEFTDLSCSETVELENMIEGAMSKSSIKPSRKIAEKFWLNPQGSIKMASNIIMTI